MFLYSVPSFATVIIYLILSPSCTVVPFVWFLVHSEITLVFVVFIIGFVTSVGGFGS